MSDSADPAPPKPEAGGEGTEHLNIKVTDGNNEVFFKIKRTTQLKKLMDAFCDRQGKAANSVRFLFDGTRVTGGDSPDTVSITVSAVMLHRLAFFLLLYHSQARFALMRNLHDRKLLSARFPAWPASLDVLFLTRFVLTFDTQLDMQDGDTLEVHQEQIGGAH
jgi:hypothetical protein